MNSEQQASFLQAKEKLMQDLAKRIANSRKILLACQNQLQECLRWEETHHEGVLLQSNPHLYKQGMAEIKLPDWQQVMKPRTVCLDPTLKFHEEIARRFKKAKKLKAGIKPVQNKILDTEKKVEKLATLQVQAADLETEQAIKLFQQEHRLNLHKTSSQKEDTPLFKEFYTAAGLKIWVGKGAKNNEKLTFKFAKGSDWWFHVRDYPGSHVVLQGDKHQDPDEESLQDALQLALEHSKAKDELFAEITVTRCKHVSKPPKGAAGQAQVANARTILVKKDAERLRRLRTKLS